MAQVNHEGSQVTSTPADARFDALWGKTYSVFGLIQSVSITSRTNSEGIPGISYRGNPAVRNANGTFELTLEGVMTHPSGVSQELYDWQSPGNDIQVDATDADENKGLRCLFKVPYLTSINFNFRVNENGTGSMTFAGEDTVWTDNIALLTPTIGNGKQFNPTFFDQIVVVYEDPDDIQVVVSGIQSASFAATLDRTEVLHIGQRTPIDRAVTFPFAVTVTVEALGEDADKIVNYNNSFNWHTFSGGDGLTVAVYGGTIASGILEANPTVIASGLRPMEGSMTVSTGTPVTTVTTSYGGWNLEW